MQSFSTAFRYPIDQLDAVPTNAAIKLPSGATKYSHDAADEDSDDGREPNPLRRSLQQGQEGVREDTSVDAVVEVQEGDVRGAVPEGGATEGREGR